MKIRTLEALAEVTARSLSLPRVPLRRLDVPIVFFVGSGRSGTNMLAKILSGHPQLAIYPTEANHLLHPALYPYRHSALAGEVPPDFVDPKAFAEASWARGGPRNLLTLGLAHELFRRTVRPPRGARQVVNKSVMITFLIERLLPVFPRARFVHIYRDGRAVALSYARKDIEKLRATPGIERFLPDLEQDTFMEACARYWVAVQDEIEAVQARHPSLDIHAIRYEDFCADPQPHLRALLETLDVDPHVPLDLSEVSSQNFKFREAGVELPMTHRQLERLGYEI